MQKSEPFTLFKLLRIKLMSIFSAEIAANRFGMGARAGELALARVNPRQWLMNQLQPIQFNKENGDLARAYKIMALNAQVKKNIKKTLTDKTDNADNAENNKQKKSLVNNMEMKEYREQSANMLRAMQMETLEFAINSRNSFAARLLDFFSNHFSVSGQGMQMRILAPLLEREAIAPNLVGNFSDMLLAVTQHPSMLIYLNNEKSIGPDTAMARKSKRGLNENLGREILELHTLGVNGGYTQADVRELSMAITGWSVYGNRESHAGFVFRQRAHQPGSRKVLNKTYAQKNERQGEAILLDLANHPATAQHLSFKLARHFIADEPPPALVKAMANTWIATDGNIKMVMQAMIEHADSWQPARQKYKTPREFVISALRIINSLEPIKLPRFKLLNSLAELGQEPFKAGSPAGYGDVSSAWDGAEALMARIDWANQIAARSKVKAATLLEVSLGDQISERTLSAVKRAESRQQSLVLALMSPEFLRR